MMIMAAEAKGFMSQVLTESSFQSDKNLGDKKKVLTNTHRVLTLKKKLGNKPGMVAYTFSSSY